MADFKSFNVARTRGAERIKRLQNPKPVYDRVAPEIEKMARAAIDNSRSPAGQQFARLAPSTLAQRKPGEGTKPLYKTGAGYRGIRCFASSRAEMRLIFPAHLRFHMRAGPNRPKRNAFPIEIGADGKPHPIPRVDKLIRNTFRAYQLELKPLADIPLAAE